MVTVLAKSTIQSIFKHYTKPENSIGNTCCKSPLTTKKNVFCILFFQVSCQHVIHMRHLRGMLYYKNFTSYIISNKSFTSQALHLKTVALRDALYIYQRKNRSRIETNLKKQDTNHNYMTNNFFRNMSQLSK